MTIAFRAIIGAAGNGGGGGDPGGGPYRYIRLNITSVNGATAISIREIQYRATVGGADQTGAGTATASSEASATFSAAKAFDNGSGSWLTANGVTSGWIKYDFGAGNEVDVAQYLITAGAGTQAPNDWTLEGSNDDSSWDVLHTVTDESGWINGETRTYAV